MKLKKDYYAATFKGFTKNKVIQGKDILNLFE